MKTSSNCYAKRYMNLKQSNSRKHLNIHHYPTPSPLTLTTTPHKSSKSKPKTHLKIPTNISLTEVSVDTDNNNTNNNNNISKSLIYAPKSNNFIIIAYEQSITFLFSLLKEILDDTSYNQTKKSFFEELEKNLLIPPKNDYSSLNNKTTLSSNNSIMSMLQESKNKCCPVHNISNNSKHSNYSNVIHNKSFTKNNKNNLNFISHKSLYKLSKLCKKVNTSSPDNNKQINTSNSFIHHYYNSFHTHNSCSGKRKVKDKHNSSSIHNTTTNNNNNNISVSNIMKNLDFQKRKYPPKANSIKKDTQHKIPNGEEVVIKEQNDKENGKELLSQIKNSLDDNLKGFFEFSYGNFLNKETERECTNRSRIPHK